MTRTTAPKADCIVSERWIEADPAQFREKFNRKSFELEQLPGNASPVSQLPKLLDLAERTLKRRPKEIYYDAGDIKIRPPALGCGALSGPFPWSKPWSALRRAGRGSFSARLRTTRSIAFSSIAVWRKLKSISDRESTRRSWWKISSFS